MARVIDYVTVDRFNCNEVGDDILECVLKDDIRRRLEEEDYEPEITIDIVDEIDVTMELGGELCRHMVAMKGFEGYYDGEKEFLSQPEFEEHGDGEEPCIVSTYEARITNGSFVIQVCVSTTSYGKTVYHIEKLVITPAANREKLAKLLRLILSEVYIPEQCFLGE